MVTEMPWGQAVQKAATEMPGGGLVMTIVLAPRLPAALVLVRPVGRRTEGTAERGLRREAAAEERVGRGERGGGPRGGGRDRAEDRAVAGPANGRIASPTLLKERRHGRGRGGERR